ncbi:hypothetical protein [Nocardioides coralli]|uniref:hypothetical protein n=1 Tax=Nocardioides coralli TaxID=2872154 RepID=UPI001CA46CAF|nr:hypothetical protein [Nocardioides coralli]QZY30572.1 hypothetical protein K6T13_07995 [Nocardioides coralli]
MSQAHPETPRADAVRTGVAAVDEVLDSLAGLDELDVADHPPVFESAHARLRAALDGDDA